MRAERRGDVELRILLDTSACVGFKRGIDEVVDVIVNAESILISPIRAV
jgi:hypothetical protein